jgi:hypothetical protein
MNHSVRIEFLALILLATASTVLAANNAVISGVPISKKETDPASVFIQQEFHGKATIIRRFAAPLHLTGYVIELPQPQTPLKPPLYSVIYTDPTNAYVLVGVGIFDRSGKNQTRLALEEYAPHTDYSAAYEATESSAYFKEGQAGATIVYAFLTRIAFSATGYGWKPVSL